MNQPNPTYKALGQPLSIPAVGPDGLKRSINVFPKVGGLRDPGLGAFKLHLPYFLRNPRGFRNEDPAFGSSLYTLFDTEDERQAVEIVRRVVREEIPGRFGKYLDAIQAFDVTVHRETRTMDVSVVLTPHGAGTVSWSFELRFPPEEEMTHRDPERPRPSPQAMNDPRAAELIQVARHYYPAGYPVWEDDDEEPVLAYQRTPEYQRWHELLQKARDDWKQWDDFLDGLRSALPGHDLRDVTYPLADACSRICLYLREPLPDGGRIVTRVVGAVCILAPLYLVYTATTTVGPDKIATQPRLSFEPSGEAKPYADTLARHIEQVFGYRPFPLELADVPLPDLRVESLYESPTLLGALFASRDTLANLP
jgi:hypothetical protein